jgi:hypothetical protein
VDALLAEKRIPHEVLPAGQRERWVEVVRDQVLNNPALGKRLF